MTRVILLAAVLGIAVGTLSGCSDKSTPAGATPAPQGGTEPVSTLKGTGRLPKGPQ